jgi:hypothetical protein
VQLSDIRTEVQNKGFDPTLFGNSRINQFINDGYMLIARRADYYIDEATDAFSTVQGTSNYAFPADFARARSLFDTNRNAELLAVSIRDIDRSSTTQGAPSFYAIDGANVHVYPTPDGVYPLELRYWKMPALLVNDTDVPTLPTDWHHLLWVYATWQCYESEDDPQMGQYWMNRFNTELAMFQADQKFPDSDIPHQARGMWEQEATLTPSGWALWYGPGF